MFFPPALRNIALFGLALLTWTASYGFGEGEETGLGFPFLFALFAGILVLAWPLANALNSLGKTGEKNSNSPSQPFEPGMASIVPFESTKRRSAKSKSKKPARKKSARAAAKARKTKRRA